MTTWFYIPYLVQYLAARKRVYYFICGAADLQMNRRVVISEAYSSSLRTSIIFLAAGEIEDILFLETVIQGFISCISHFIKA